MGIVYDSSQNTLYIPRYMGVCVVAVLYTKLFAFKSGFGVGLYALWRAYSAIRFPI